MFSLDLEKDSEELDWNIAELGQDFGWVRLDLLGFCLKLSKLQEAKESSASPDNLFYGKLHMIYRIFVS